MLRPHVIPALERIYPDLADTHTAGIDRDKAGTDMDIEFMDGTLLPTQHKAIRNGYGNICHEICSTAPTRNGWSVLRKDYKDLCYWRPKRQGETTDDGNEGELLVWDQDEYLRIFAAHPEWENMRPYAYPNQGWTTTGCNTPDGLILPLLTTLRRTEFRFGESK